MALLGIRKLRGVNAALAGLLVVSITGCVVLEVLGLRDKPLSFSHARHLQESLDCTDCHVAGDDGRRMGLPTQSQCMLCHTDIDAAKPPERQISQLFTDGKFNASAVAWVSDEVKFSHATHVDKGLDCAQCHQGIRESTAVDKTLAVSMNDCRSCHASQGLNTDCAACHTQISTTVKPSNHSQLWKKLHGQAVRGELDGPANDCAMCHTEATCNTCHQDEKPASHNMFWREKSHGVAAAMDRDNCAACHKEDSCERCHADTKPMNHVGAWGQPMDTHCLTCHIPVQGETCAVCHKGTPSHLQAAPKPAVPPHNASMDCRSCHGVTAPLPHVDNGDDCNFCHQ